MAKKTSAGLTVERAHLVAALTAVTKAVETRNTIPILANVHLSQDGDRLALRTSDLAIEITTHIAASGELPTTTTNARTLLDIVKKFPAGAEVSLELDGEIMIVKSGRSRFRLGTISADSFPDASTKGFGEAFEADLAALFAPVSFAISNEETRFYLNGVYMHTVAGKLRAVATDGHRLARHDGTEAPDFTGVIVPKKTVGIMPTGTVLVELSDTRIRITTGDLVIVSKLIDGVFPDYERVIPKNNDKVLTLDRTALSGALDRVGVLASADGGKALRVNVAEDRLELTCRSSDGNVASEDVPVTDGFKFEIGFNTSYLAEIVRIAGGDRVTLRLNDANSPSIIEGANDNWLAVLMPMRVAA